MGVYDLPASIDYVLSVTKQRNLYYIGHSMGTTMYYVMASTRPEYNSKIRLMISLSPVAYMAHIKSSIFRVLYGPLGVSWAAISVGIIKYANFLRLQTSSAILENLLDAFQNFFSASKARPFMKLQISFFASHSDRKWWIRPVSTNLYRTAD